MKPYKLLWCYFDIYHIVFFIPTRNSIDLANCEFINVWQDNDHITTLAKRKECDKAAYNVIINRSMSRQQKLDIILKNRNLFLIINLFLKSNVKLYNKKLTKDQIIAKHLVTWEGKENLKKAMLIV